MIDYSYVESGFVYGEVPYGFNLTEILDAVKGYQRWSRPAGFIEPLFDPELIATLDIYGRLPMVQQVDGRGAAAGALIIPAQVYANSSIELSFTGKGSIDGTDWTVPRGYLPEVGYDFYGRCPFTGTASAHYSYVVSSKSADKRYLSSIIVLYVACCGRVWFMAMGTGAFLPQQLDANSLIYSGQPSFYDVSIEFEDSNFLGQWSIYGGDKLAGRLVPLLELRARVPGFSVFPWKVFVIDDDLYSDDNFIKPSVPPIGFVDDTLYGRSTVFVVPVEDAKDFNKEILDKYVEMYPDGAPGGITLRPTTEWIPILPFLDTV